MAIAAPQRVRLDGRIPTATTAQEQAWIEQAAFNERLLASGATMAPPGAVPPERIRAQRRRTAAESAPLDTGTALHLPGPRGAVRARVFSSENPTATYLHFHGGGWVFGSPEEYAGLLSDIATHAGVRVISIDYRLAPEDPHPAAIDDAEAAALWLLENGAREFGTETVLLGGESAGAHLAVMTLLRLRDRHQATTQIRAVQLAYGIYDLGLTASQEAWGERMLVLSTPWLRWFYDQVTPGLDTAARRSPDISPLYADLTGLPAALFTIGTEDPLLDDSLLMATAWRLAGNKSELAVYPGGAHGLNVHPTAIGHMARQRIEDFLVEHAAPEQTRPQGPEVAAAWRKAVEDNDMDAFARLYDPAAEVWTSIERKARPLAEHLALVAAARGACDSWKYEDVRCSATKEGFVSQHTVRLQARGAERSTVAAVVGTVRNGRITHLDEHFNRKVEQLA